MSYPNRRYSSFYDLKSVTNTYSSYSSPQRYSYRQPVFSQRTIPYSSTVTFAPTTTTTTAAVNNNNNNNSSINNTQNQISQISNATAASNIVEIFNAKSNVLPPAVTDVLQAEVDYNVNEIDNIMICKGKIIEIQSGDLSSKYGLIARCMFINNLLKVANLSEENLNSDPLFLPDESKAIIKFNSMKNAEEFINSHNCKYRIVLKNLKTPNDSDSSSKSILNESNNKTTTSLKNSSKIYEIPIISDNKPANNSVSTTISTFKIAENSSKINNDHHHHHSKTTKFDNSTKAEAAATTSTVSNNEASRSLIINEPLNGQTTLSLTLTDESKTNSNSSNERKHDSFFDSNNFSDGLKFESNVDTFNEEEANANDRSLILKNKEVEGYETLTIRAKLKQRVGPNRTKHVTLKDIDSIMRNVVTVVQDEFMKRFPSATSNNNTLSITDASDIDNNN